MTRPLSIIGVGSGWGAKDMGTGCGPSALMDQWTMGASMPVHLSYWHGEDLPRKSQIPLSDEEAAHRLKHVLDVTLDVSKRVFDTLSQEHLPLVIGGDHSIAVGTWSGVKKYYADEDMGLIWVDAHMDAHTLESSESHSIHGMPVAALLGYGDPALTKMSLDQPKFKPENVVLMGIRSFEEEEESLLESLGVRIMSMKEIAQFGFPLLFEEALAIATKGRQQKFGLSIDVDAFDPSEAPGTGTMEPEGLYFVDVVDPFRGIINHPLLAAVEIAELNPLLDDDGSTVQFVRNLITLMKGV